MKSSCSPVGQKVSRLTDRDWPSSSQKGIRHLNLVTAKPVLPPSTYLYTSLCGEMLGDGAGSSQWKGQSWPQVSLDLHQETGPGNKELQLASCLSCCFHANIPDAVSLPFPQGGKEWIALFPVPVEVGGWTVTRRVPAAMERPAGRLMASASAPRAGRGSSVTSPVLWVQTTIGGGLTAPLNHSPHSSAEQRAGQDLNLSVMSEGNEV